MRTPAFAAAAVLFVFAAGCDTNDGGAFVLDPYLGTYTGTTEGTILFLGETTLVDQPSTATFATPANGRVTLTISPVPADPDTPPQVIEGTYTRSGIRFSTTDATTGQVLAFTIDEDGTVAGTTTLTQEGVTGTLTVSGSLTPRRFVFRQRLTTVPSLASADVGFDGTK